MVVYGERSPEVMTMLEIADKELSNFQILESMPENKFLYLLSIASLYVRPNDIDSFGIVCADAVLSGTPVVASNVCDRFPGVTLFEAGNYQDFANKVNQCLLEDLKSSSKTTEQVYAEKIIQYEEVYRL